MAFLTEMSNLSPPIIYPPPSASRSAPPETAGRSQFVGPAEAGCGQSPQADGLRPRDWLLHGFLPAPVGLSTACGRAPSAMR
jgi:hypothetical protein